MAWVVVRRLSNGVYLPAVQLGTYRLGSGDSAAFTAALESGYRAFDCARYYENEEAIGAFLTSYNGSYGAIEDVSCLPDGFEAVSVDDFERNFSLPHGAPNQHVFLTNKVWPDCFVSEERIRAIVDDHLRMFKRDQVDLLLMHWPQYYEWMGDNQEALRSGGPEQRKAVWRVYEALYREKKVRAIGVSNFKEEHLREVMDDVNSRPDGVPIMVNQVEGSPWVPEFTGIREYCEANQIVIETYRPLGGDKTKYGRLQASTDVAELARRCGVSEASLVIRWNLEKGNVVVPKSSNPERVRNNIGGLFTFKLPADVSGDLDSLGQ